MAKYKIEEIEHTADYGVKVWAEDEKTLFEKCVEIFESAIVDMEKVEARVEKQIEVEGETREELLLNLLRELLFIFDTEGFVFKEAKVEFKGDKNLILKGKGENYNPEKHTRRLNIKAITYHNFYLKKKDRGIETQIIFDV